MRYLCETSRLCAFAVKCIKKKEVHTPFTQCRDVSNMLHIENPAYNLQSLTTS